MKSQKPEPAWRRWTPAEEKQLQDMLDAGKTAVEISRKLRRTFQAIYGRLQRVYRRLARTASICRRRRGNDDEGFINSSRYQLFGSSIRSKCTAQDRGQALAQMKPTARLKLGLKAAEVGAACNLTRSRIYGFEASKFILPKQLPRKSDHSPSAALRHRRSRLQADPNNSVRSGVREEPSEAPTVSLLRLALLV
jgi:hypothetical protein